VSSSLVKKAGKRSVSTRLTRLNIMPGLSPERTPGLDRPSLLPEKKLRRYRIGELEVESVTRGKNKGHFLRLRSRWREPSPRKTS